MPTANDIAEIVQPWLTTLQGKKKKRLILAPTENPRVRIFKNNASIDLSGALGKKNKTKNPDLIFNRMFNLKLWLERAEWGGPGAVRRNVGAVSANPMTGYGTKAVLFQPQGPTLWRERPPHVQQGSDGRRVREDGEETSC